MALSRRDFLVGLGACGLLTSGLVGQEQPAPPPRRALGLTGITAPLLGLGTATAGYHSRREASRLYGRALDLGVTWLDTAPRDSGYGLAQVALGDVLRTRGQEAFVVTKLWEPDGEAALASLRSSLAELQVDRVDLLLAHSVGSDKMDPERVSGPGGVMEALAIAKSDGLCRFVGVSAHNRPERVLRLLDRFPLDVAMMAVNPAARSVYGFETQAWPEAARRGLGLVAMKVFGGVKVAGATHSRFHGEDLRALLGYALDLPGLSCAVVGCADEQQLAATLRWVHAHRALRAEATEALVDRGVDLGREMGPAYGPP